MRHILSPSAALFHADCRDALRQLPDNSIDSCVTDPPYALVSIMKRFGGANAAQGNDAYMRASAGFMGKTWDTGETAFSTEFWAEVLRVLKPGAHVVAFGASRGYHRMACAIEDAEFEIRDSLCWIYATGFPKSMNVSKGIDKAAGAERTEVIGKSNRHGGGIVGNGTSYEISPEVPMLYAPATPAAREWEGWGTALKPAFEPIVLARKPLSEPTVAANVLRWRTGALNIDACRVEAPGKGWPKTRRYAPGQMTGGEGNLRGQTEETIDQSDLGRWPTNVVHDGSDEVVGAFPRTAPAKAGKRNAPKSGGTFGDYAGDEPERLGHSDAGGSAARFFYSAKASKADRNGSKHPTVKPISLMEWLCTLITPPGGTVLDPFAGSGTTGIAAQNKGFQVVLCEREAEYVTDIKARFAGSIPASGSKFLSAAWKADTQTARL